MYNELIGRYFYVVLFEYARLYYQHRNSTIFFLYFNSLIYSYSIFITIDSMIHCQLQYVSTLFDALSIQYSSIQSRLTMESTIGSYYRYSLLSVSKTVIGIG